VTRPVDVIRPPSITPGSLLADLLRLLRHRDLFFSLVWFRLRVRYAQSVLGYAWAVLQPLLLLGIYTVLFSWVARLGSDGIPYTVFALSGLVPWIYLANGISSSAAGVVSHAHLIQRVHFPREILPLSYVGAAFVDAAIALALLVAVMTGQGVALTRSAAWVVPVFMVATALLTGVALIVSCAQVRVRDVGLALPVFLQVWMLATPIAYPASAVPAELQSLYSLNPMVGVVEGFRAATAGGTAPDPWGLGWSAAVSIVLLLAGYALFRAQEPSFADAV
jgi:lipopolysaccharide transport system permease protein